MAMRGRTGMREEDESLSSLPDGSESTAQLMAGAIQSQK